MNIHYINIKDRATLIFAAVIELDSTPKTRERFIENGWKENSNLFLLKLTPKVQIQIDPFNWSFDTGRTMRIAHLILDDVYHVGGWMAIIDLDEVDVEKMP